MHARVDELLSLRDGESVDAVTRAHVADCAVCRDELERLRALREALRESAPLEPPADAWQRIRQQAEARGTATTPSAQRGHPRLAWAAGLGGALAATLAALAVLISLPTKEPATPPMQPSARASSTQSEPDADADLERLIARSHRLERTLRHMGARPRVMRAGTAGTIANLEDHIAMIDYRMTAGDERGTSSRVSAALWRQRVDLMESLVTLRYAQAADDAKAVPAKLTWEERL